jgi:hypothetical protein
VIAVSQAARLKALYRPTLTVRLGYR